MFTVISVRNKNMYVVYNIRYVEGATYFLLFKEKEGSKTPGFREWVWENSNLYMPSNIK